MLEEEVDKKTPEEQALVPQSSSVGALLPTVLSFLSSFPDYLNILIQCTRKTEIGSWKTLFATLPPPQELFEKALEDGLLKAAGGFLLVLHTFEELPKDSELCVRLLIRAKEVGDWDLCKELARFLMAVDDTGDTLREAMRRLDLETPSEYCKSPYSKTHDLPCI